MNSQLVLYTSRVVYVLHKTAHENPIREDLVSLCKDWSKALPVLELSNRNSPCNLSLFIESAMKVGELDPAASLVRLAKMSVLGFIENSDSLSKLRTCIRLLLRCQSDMNEESVIEATDALALRMVDHVCMKSNDEDMLLLVKDLELYPAGHPETYLIRFFESNNLILLIQVGRIFRMYAQVLELLKKTSIKSSHAMMLIQDPGYMGHLTPDCFDIFVEMKRSSRHLIVASLISSSKLCIESSSTALLSCLLSRIDMYSNAIPDFFVQNIREFIRETPALDSSPNLLTLFLLCKLLLRDEDLITLTEQFFPKFDIELIRNAALSASQLSLVASLSKLQGDWFNYSLVRMKLLDNQTSSESLEDLFPVLLECFRKMNLHEASANVLLREVRRALLTPDLCSWLNVS